NVNIHDLNVNSSDDAIALKSDCAIGTPMLTDNVTIANSTAGSSGANGLQIGSETWGNFQNICWTNDKVTQSGKAGIGVQMNDGAIIKNVTYDTITTSGTANPIFINTTSLLRAPLKTPGHAENITIRNVTSTGFSVPGVISGEAGIPHQNIVLENV